MKTCNKCKAEKPLEEFHRRSDIKDGRGYECKECSKIRMKEWYTADPDKARAKNMAWYKANPDKVRNCKYQRKYGITLDDYEQLLAKQGRACAICKTKESGGKGTFHVDHDHVTGQIRALLCNKCNVALGQMNDDPDRLEAAARYLREHSNAVASHSIAGTIPAGR